MKRSRIPTRKPLILAACLFALTALVTISMIAIGPAETLKAISVTAIGLGMVAQATPLRCRHDRRLTAAAAVASGEVFQVADGRAAVYTGLNAAASGEGTNFTTTGQFTVQKTTGVVITDGQPVFWDHSANTATYAKANDRDFYLGTAIGDAASADTELVVNLNVQPVYLVDIARDPFDSTIVLTAGTPTLTRLGGAHKLAFSATDEAQKIDILSKDGFAISSNWIVEGEVEVVDNGDSGEGDFNIGVASASDVTDADSIAEACFLHIDSNALDILAESDDGTTEVAATDTTVNYAEGTRFHFLMDGRDPSDVQIYINGALVLSGSVFDLSAGTGPLKLLVHQEKSGNDTLFEVHVDSLRVRTAEQ